MQVTVVRPRIRRAPFAPVVVRVDGRPGTRLRNGDEWQVAGLEDTAEIEVSTFPAFWATRRATDLQDGDVLIVEYSYSTPRLLFTLIMVVVFYAARSTWSLSALIAIGVALLVMAGWSQVLSLRRVRGAVSRVAA